MKKAFSIVAFLAISTQAHAMTDLFNCDDGTGYIQTSTSVGKDEATGKIIASINIHDIENPGDYFVKLSALNIVENADGSVTVSSKVKGRYLLEVSSDKKTARLTATNVDAIDLSCK